VETMTPEKMALYRRLEEIFMPHITKTRRRLYPKPEGTARFVHYTSAEAALSIIESKRFWMRNAVCMDDYSEVQHGYDLLSAMLKDQHRLDRLIEAVNKVVPNMANDVVRSFDQGWPQTQRYTYIGSLSEHRNDEDQYGRLSMWRASGNRGNRVAIILAIPWFTGAALALNVAFNPVAYFRPGELAQELEQVISNVERETDFLKQVEPTLIAASLFNVFLWGATCIKHEAFNEELEWRALFFANQFRSQSLIKRTVRCVAGVPQHVCELPLDARVSPDIAGLEFSRILDSIIIGPTQYPLPVLDALVDSLKNAGVADADGGHRVRMSLVPLRT
jgi:hypothetical protein